MGRIVSLKNEGEAANWYEGYVRRRIDMIATECAVYPINFILQFYYWFRHKTYYRPQYEREVAKLVNDSYTKAYKNAKQYWYRKGTEDTYKEIRDALARGWVLTSSGITKVNKEGKLGKVMPVKPLRRTAKRCLETQ